MQQQQQAGKQGSQRFFSGVVGRVCPTFIEITKEGFNRQREEKP